VIDLQRLASFSVAVSTDIRVSGRDAVGAAAEIAGRAPVHKLFTTVDAATIRRPS
jgi:hypothetical protein